MSLNPVSAPIAFSRNFGSILRMPQDLLPLRVQARATLRPATPWLGESEIPLQVEKLSTRGVRCLAEDGLEGEGRCTLSLPWSSERGGRVFLEATGTAHRAARPSELVLRFQSKPALHRHCEKPADGAELPTPAFFEPRPVNQGAFTYYARLGRVQAHVEAHLQDRISLKQIAGTARMESTSFSDFFRHRVGISFRDWLQQLRLARALQIIARNNESITNIALDAGFPSIRSLETTCHKYLQMAPLDFKKLVRPC